MGDVIPLFGVCRARGDTATGRPEFDPLTNLLSVTKYWETAITQIARCEVGLSDQPQKQLKIELADLEKSCAHSSRYWTNTKQSAATDNLGTSAVKSEPVR